MNDHLKTILILALLTSCSCASDYQQEPMLSNVSLPSFFKFMAGHEEHQLTLTTDLSKLINEKELETGQEALLTCTHGADTCFEMKLKVNSRGKTRKKYCGFPPIRLNFNKTDLKNRGLNQMDHYKLVTHCEEDSEELLLKEYLVYELYNILTEKSLDVQLLNINYVDSYNKVPPFEKFAILIESVEELCERENCELVKGDNEKLSSVDGGHYKLMTVFQYMVGNTDWNMSKRHNIKLIEAGTKGPIPVPYDFDYCGLVNAPYAVPHPQLPIKSIRERLFQYRSKKPDLEETLEHFQIHKESILSYCRKFNELDEASRQEVISYLESFYDIIEDPDLLNQKLLKKK